MATPKGMNPPVVMAAQTEAPEGSFSEKKTSQERDAKAAGGEVSEEEVHDVNKDVQLQHGVVKIQAITKAWTFKYLIITYIL